MSWQSAKPILIGFLVYIVTLVAVKILAGIFLFSFIEVGKVGEDVVEPMILFFYLYALLDRCIPAAVAGYFVSRQDGPHPLRDAFIVGFAATSAISMIDMSGQSSWAFLHLAAFGLASGTFGTLGAALDIARKAQPGRWSGLPTAAQKIMTPRREDIKPAAIVLGSALAASLVLAALQPVAGPPSHRMSYGISEGPAIVTDGDELQVGLDLVKLAYIDAPELDRMCPWRSRQWACGVVAAQQLEQMIQDRPVECRSSATAGNKAVCYVESTASENSLNALMVENGWAKADIPEGESERDQAVVQAIRWAEEKARTARRGIWSAKSR